MPYISRLNVSNFRNLSAIDISPHPKLNIVFGDNGAGKSSLLESISVLAHGKSFRTHKYRGWITEDKSESVLRAQLIVDNVESRSIGIRRKRSGEFTIKADNEKINSASQLARMLPVLVLEPHSFLLLEGSSKVRRKFFDWFVFHVKHSFSGDWKQVIHCYKQRNSLLRRDKIGYSDLEPWDYQIGTLAARIDNARTAAFGDFVTRFDSVMDELVTSGRLPSAVRVELKTGWKDDSGSYADQLRDQFTRDRSYGYSTLGPHKSDLDFVVERKKAIDILSRGQQKLVVTALFMVVAQSLTEMVNVRPVIVIDDLPSELDGRNQWQLGEWLRNLDSQVFVTGIDGSFSSKLLANTSDCEDIVLPNEVQNKEFRMFHVKHGEIEQG